MAPNSTSPAYHSQQLHHPQDSSPSSPFHRRAVSEPHHSLHNLWRRSRPSRMVRCRVLLLSLPAYTRLLRSRRGRHHDRRQRASHVEESQSGPKRQGSAGMAQGRGIRVASGVDDFDCSMDGLPSGALRAGILMVRSYTRGTIPWCINSRRSARTWRFDISVWLRSQVLDNTTPSYSTYSKRYTVTSTYPYSVHVERSRRDTLNISHPSGYVRALNRAPSPRPTQDNVTVNGSCTREAARAAAEVTGRVNSPIFCECPVSHAVRHINFSAGILGKPLRFQNRCYCMLDQG